MPGWFLGILVFLVLSTSFCIYRQAPLMLREIRSFREHATAVSLRGFAHQASFPVEISQASLLQRLTGYLTGQGFRSSLAEVTGSPR